MSSMTFRSHKEPKRVTLSVTPLIDVLFLLIIFFTLTSTFKRVGELELQLPDSETAAAPDAGEQDHTVELIITDEGELLLEGEDVEMRALRARFLAIREQDPEARVMLKAEAGVNHGEVVRLLDIVRGAGFPGVGIGTHIQAEGRPPQ